MSYKKGDAVIVNERALMKEYHGSLGTVEHINLQGETPTYGVSFVDQSSTIFPEYCLNCYSEQSKSEDNNAIVLRGRNLTLPTDSAERKNYPLLSGCVKYFPAALAGVANISKLGNDKHNPGEPLHHARSKSIDHGDCIIRHLIDTEDLLASKARNEQVTTEMILTEANQLAWRALAYCQDLHEKLGAPMAPGAKK